MRKLLLAATFLSTSALAQTVNPPIIPPGSSLLPLNNTWSGSNTYLPPLTLGAGTPLSWNSATINAPNLTGATVMIPPAVDTTNVPAFVIERSATGGNPANQSNQTLFVGTLLNMNSGGQFPWGLNNQMDIESSTVSGNTAEAMRSQCTIGSPVANSVYCWGATLEADALTRAITGTGSITTTTLTMAVSTTLYSGDHIYGTNVLADTYVVTGGTGTSFTVSQSQTVGSTTLTFIGAASRSYTIGLESQATVAMFDAPAPASFTNVGFSTSFLASGAAGFLDSRQARLNDAGFLVNNFTPGGGFQAGFMCPAEANVVTANITISGKALTINSGLSGTPAIGMSVVGAGVTAGTYLVSGSGSSWVVNNSQTAGPISMTLVRKDIVNSCFYGGSRSGFGLDLSHGTWDTDAIVTPGFLVNPTGGVSIFGTTSVGLELIYGTFSSLQIQGTGFSVDLTGHVNAQGLLTTAVAPTASSGQIGYGGTTVSPGTATCPSGTIGGQTVVGCEVHNVAGRVSYLPYF